MNLLAGSWTTTKDTEEVLDPLNGDAIMRVPLTSVGELPAFVNSMRTCSKSGLHNPLKNVDRYVKLGEVSDRIANAMKQPAIADFFAKLTMRVSPKSYAQALNEVKIVWQFLDNFSGDNVRYLARGFNVPGDHDGQQSGGYRWPYGPVAIVTPFNFPIEIPALQLMGALYMGNRPTLKVDSKTAVVMEQWLRLAHKCGLPEGDVDFINTDGPTMHRFLLKAQPRNTLFTGSSRVAERLARDLHGRIKIEDAGFDWKILGPDVQNADYVAWQCDQDAYACSGQKCSAQSMLFAHSHWVKAGLFEKMQALAAKRNLADLTCGPVMTWTTEGMLSHVKALLEIPGARLLFGGTELVGHTIPKCYGAIEPTAVFVPLREALKPRNFKLVTKEVFGPLQVVTEYKTRELSKVLTAMENMSEHLTAAVVSNNDAFRDEVLARTVNGTTYAGLRARTTGAPQNHWFGPSNDPRGAGIGTREAIRLVWSSHREIIRDTHPLPNDWVAPITT